MEMALSVGKLNTFIFVCLVGISIYMYMGGMEIMMPKKRMPIENYICMGDIDRIEEKLINGANPNKLVAQTGETLFDVVMSISCNPSIDRHKMIELLVKYGGDININNKGNETPLMSAVVAGDLKSVKYLLSNGANPNNVNLSGKSAIMMIDINAPYITIEIAKLLIEAGASVNVEDNQGLTPMEWAVSIKVEGLLSLFQSVHSEK